MSMQDEATDLMSALAGALEDSAEGVAVAYYALFSELVNAGFTEEQAMEILTDANILEGEV